MSNIYVVVALILLLGFVLGRLLRQVRLTEVLAYLFVGVIMGPLLHFKAPEQFFTIITAITLAFVAYTVGLSFSSTFLKKSGREILTILVVEVLVTSIVVGIFIYLLTEDAALSIIAASLAPATAPAGTVAVLRDLRAKGKLTDACIAIVGLDDAAAIIIYSFGLVCTKMLLGSKVGFASWVYYPVVSPNHC